MVQMIQIVGVVFAFFAFLHVYISYKKNIIKTFGFLLWSGVWFCAVVVSLYPDVLKVFSRFFQIGRSIDVLIYTSIIVLFYLIFNLYIKYDSSEKQLTKIVRLIALKDTEISRKKKKE